MLEIAGEHPDKLLHRATTEAIIGSAFEVHRELGYGFLERVYQRPPDPEEIKLGLEFIAETPQTEPVAAQDRNLAQSVANDGDALRKKQAAMQQARKGNGNGNGLRKRPPLNAWEEYAHALLQANEVSFVN